MRVQMIKAPSEVQEKRKGRPYATLEYSYNEKTTTLFLTDELHNYYILKVNGRIINSKRTFMSKDFIDMFKNVPGWEFIAEETIHKKPQKTIFGLKVEIIVDRNTQRFIKIKLIADNKEELTNNALYFEEEVKRHIGEAPTKNIIWENTSYC